MVCKLSLKCRAVTEREVPVARTDQTSVILSEPPSSRAVMSALRLDKGQKHSRRVEQADMRSQDESGNTENDFNLQVRIDRSVMVDTRAQQKVVCPTKDQDPFWDGI